MPRFVFRKKSGEPAKPIEEVAAHASTLGAKVLSQTANMLYIEGSKDASERLSKAAPDYVCSPEIKVAPPRQPRVTVKGRR